ncbi:MAG TPA: copper resistance protein CopC [Actinomycetota bacterium]|nr:copper resistance protein CopC [Actinomycetota bacterium]
MMRRRIRAGLNLAFALAVGLVAVVGPGAWVGASAHALPVTTSPANGATLQTPPTEIEITYSETPDLAHSLIQVLDTSGKQWASGHPARVPGQPASAVALPIPGTLPKGDYTVTWKTISTVDGHLATGSFSFGVGEAPPTSTAGSGPSVRSPGPSEVAAVARWLYLAGLIGLLGLAFTELVTLGGRSASQPPRRLQRLLLASWALALIGAVGILQASRAGAQLGLADTLSSSIGHAFLLRAAPLVVVAIGLVLLLRPGAARRTGLLAVAAGTLASMLADVVKGHADARSTWIWFRVGTQWVHFIAAGIWIGGLAGLLLCLGPLGEGNRAGPAKRFSFFAGISIVAVGITGTLRAIDEVGSWKGLFHTSFGQVIIVKVVLFGGLAALGALNRYRNVGRVDAHPGGLRAAGRVELMTMAAVLAATSLLQNLAPSTSVLAAQHAAQLAAQVTSLPPITASASDFAETYKLGLSISPGGAGFDTYTVTIRNFLTQAPEDAQKVSIGFTAANNPAVGPSNLDLTRSKLGTYTGKGANMGILGPWNLTITVENGPTKSVQVPVTVVTESPDQPVKSQAFKGSPTVYNISLPDGSILQIYIDPLNLGVAEFHATFLNAAATTETQMQPAIWATAQKVPGGPVGPLLTYRDLDGIGHFVADARVPKGTYLFNVVGTTVTGTALGGSLVLPVT